MVRVAAPARSLSSSPADRSRELEVVPQDRVAEVLAFLWRDPAKAGFRGVRSLFDLASRSFLGISLEDCEAFLRRQEIKQTRAPPVTGTFQPLLPSDIGWQQADNIVVTWNHTRKEQSAVRVLMQELRESREAATRLLTALAGETAPAFASWAAGRARRAAQLAVLQAAVKQAEADDRQARRQHDEAIVAADHLRAQLRSGAAPAAALEAARAAQACAESAAESAGVNVRQAKQELLRYRAKLKMPPARWASADGVFSELDAAQAALAAERTALAKAESDTAAALGATTERVSAFWDVRYDVRRGQQGLRVLCSWEGRGRECDTWERLDELLAADGAARVQAFVRTFYAEQARVTVVGQQPWSAFLPELQRWMKAHRAFTHGTQQPCADKLMADAAAPFQARIGALEARVLGLRQRLREMQARAGGLAGGGGEEGQEQGREQSEAEADAAQLQQFSSPAAVLEAALDATSGRRRTAQSAYLLTIMDIFSKFACCIPLQARTGENIARALEGIWLKEGPPVWLQTDNAKEFKENANVRAVCARYGVGVKNCAAYHSECMGGIERFNRTIRTAILNACKHYDAHQTWVDLLEPLVWAYNTSRHSTTTLSPFFVHRGREPRAVKQLQAWPAPGEATGETADASPVLQGGRVRKGAPLSPSRRRSPPHTTSPRRTSGSKPTPLLRAGGSAARMSSSPASSEAVVAAVPGTLLEYVSASAAARARRTEFVHERLRKGGEAMLARSLSQVRLAPLQRGDVVRVARHLLDGKLAGDLKKGIKAATESARWSDTLYYVCRILHPAEVPAAGSGRDSGMGDTQLYELCVLGSRRPVLRAHRQYLQVIPAPASGSGRLRARVLAGDADAAVLSAFVDLRPGQAGMPRFTA